jgi:apolipoprotein N-acyltransferase
MQPATGELMQARWRSLAGDGVALAAGLVMPAAFAPLGLHLLAIASLAILFLLWRDASPRRAFWRGWLFGVGLFGAGVHWVYHSMHVFGHMAAPVAVLFTAVFAVLLALYPALAGYLSNRCSAPAAAGRLLILYPTVWTLVEWFRGWFLTGFPWLDLGYSQVGAPLQGLAPITGVYGITWAVAFTAGVVALLVRSPSGRQGLIAFCVAIALWGGAWAVGTVEWTRPAGPAFQASLVQGDTPQGLKWDARQLNAILDGYARATERHWNSRLIVWPETAVPAFYRDVERPFLDPLAALARAHHTDLLIGLPVQDPRSGHYYNAMMSLGGQRDFYYKRHLVPFGEYVPLRGVLQNLLDLLHVPMSAFSSGAADQPPLRAAGYPVAVAICYEIAFGDELRSFLPRAAFLVNASNNAWFGDSSAPYQMLEMGRMRALETQRYLLSATNDGMTAIVDDHGRVVHEAPRFEVTVLTGRVQPRSGATPYVVAGDKPVLAALVLALALGGWRVRRRQL